jgi:hypothetical protein
LSSDLDKNEKIRYNSRRQKPDSPAPSRIPWCLFKEQEGTMSVEKIPLEQKSEVDPTKCYVCEAEATAVCAQCKMPICDEHQQKVQEYVTKVTIVLRSNTWPYR